MKKVKMFLVAIIVALGIQSCVIQEEVIRGDYTFNNSITTSVSYDNVWNNIIDFFAVNSITIGDNT